MKKLFCVTLAIAALLLSACGNPYSESDLESAKRQSYNEGYNAGYDRGYEDFKEIVREEYLIDGRSIRDVIDEVYDEFGMTPYEAFAVYDEYTYDWTHGGYTWKEYQEALEVMYYTASIIPYDY